MRETALIIHFIGLAMGLGTGFAHLFLGMSIAKMTKEAGLDFAIKIQAVNKMGRIGTLLLLLSGFYLIIPFYQDLFTMPLLIAKLACVLLLVGLLEVLKSHCKKALAEEAEVYLEKMKKIGKVTLPLSVFIVVLAVLVFR